MIIKTVLHFVRRWRSWKTVFLKGNDRKEHIMIRRLLKNVLGENFTENNAKLATVNFGVILLMFVLSGIMLLFLPEQISILHMGETYYPIPSVLGVWLFPIIALIVNLLFIRQNRLTKMNSGVFVILLAVMMFSYVNMMWRLCLERLPYETYLM